MERQRIIKLVTDIIQEVVAQKQIVVLEQTSLTTDLGFDSLMFVDLIVEIETEFNFEFEDEYLLIENIDKVKNIIDYVQRKVNYE